MSYGAAKAAQVNFTLSAATELARYGVTANVVHPPVTDTGWVNAATAASARSAGRRVATPEQVASIGAFDPDPVETDSFEKGPFTEKEKAGFRYAGLLHGSGNAIDEAAFAELSANFSLQEIVELTAVAAAFEFFPRFNSALQIPVTPPPEELPKEIAALAQPGC